MNGIFDGSGIRKRNVECVFLLAVKNGNVCSIRIAANVGYLHVGISRFAPCEFFVMQFSLLHANVYQLVIDRVDDRFAVTE